MNASKTLRNPARAVIELSARFAGESSKADKKNRGPAGAPNHIDMLTAVTAGYMPAPRTAIAEWGHKPAPKTRRQYEAIERARNAATRFVMPERTPADMDAAESRIAYQRDMISGQHGPDMSAKAREQARLAGISAKMAVDAHGHRVNGSDPFAAMRAECHARLGMGLGFEPKRRKAN